MRAEQIVRQRETFSTQDSQGSLRAVVSDQVPRVSCPVCGLDFAGDYGLQMHIKSQHTEINQQAKINFVRSKHSLFGLSYCRFCRVRCYNWQALEKHIAEGSCPRIKEAIAANVSMEDLYQAMLDEEELNPPVPPDYQFKHEAPFVDSGHPILSCPTRDLLRHIDAFVQLRSQCGLCRQHVRASVP